MNNQNQEAIDEIKKEIKKLSENDQFELLNQLKSEGLSFFEKPEAMRFEVQQGVLLNCEAHLLQTVLGIKTQFDYLGIEEIKKQKGLSEEEAMEQYPGSDIATRMRITARTVYMIFCQQLPSKLAEALYELTMEAYLHTLMQFGDLTLTWKNNNPSAVVNNWLKEVEKNRRKRLYTFKDTKKGIKNRLPTKSNFKIHEFAKYYEQLKTLEFWQKARIIFNNDHINWAKEIQQDHNALPPELHLSESNLSNLIEQFKKPFDNKAFSYNQATVNTNNITLKHAAYLCGLKQGVRQLARFYNSIKTKDLLDIANHTIGMTRPIDLQLSEENMLEVIKMWEFFAGTIEKKKT